jgi:hypothetical protein
LYKRREEVVVESWRGETSDTCVDLDMAWIWLVYGIYVNSLPRVEG